MDICSKLLELRLISDVDELSTRLQNIAYEFNEIQINEMNKECRKLSRSLGIDTFLLTGSLFTSFDGRIKFDWCCWSCGKRIERLLKIHS